MSMIGELRQVPADMIPELPRNKELVESLMRSDDGLSLGKAWHGLHYLLCGDANDESAVMGGVPLLRGPDWGYGPPQLVSPDQVREYLESLLALDEETLRESYDPQAMTDEDVYPGVWDRPEERESNLAWLLESFHQLRAFYQDAARHGNGILFFLS